MTSDSRSVVPRDRSGARAPELAVIVNCYNYGRFVERAIASVTRQANPRCELVVVDDGSTDDSWARIVACGVRAYRKDNGGQISACLYGLVRTRAPFVLFLDADDELVPGSLDVILSHLDPDVSKLQFPLVRIDGDGLVVGDAFPPLKTARERDHLARRVARTGVYTSPPTSGNVFRRDLCELLRDVDYETVVDGAVLFAAPFLGDVVSLATALGCYRIHGGNDSGLGGLPTAALLKRDQLRFVERVAHIGTHLAGLGYDASLSDPTHMPYYLEKEIQHAAICEVRPSLRIVLSALKSLPDLSSSRFGRAMLALFFAAAYFLPGKVGRLLLRMRLSGLKNFYEKQVRRRLRRRPTPRPMETTHGV